MLLMGTIPDTAYVSGTRPGNLQLNFFKLHPLTILKILSQVKYKEGMKL